MSHRSIALARFGANFGTLPDSGFLLEELSTLLVEGFTSTGADDDDEGSGRL